MLKNIVQLILKSQKHLGDGALFCNNISIDSQTKDSIEILEQHNIIENTDYENEIGEVVNIELSLARLNIIGYYQDKNSLITKNKYAYPTGIFYVAEIDKFSDDIGIEFYHNFQSVISLIDAVKLISRYSYTDVDVDYSLIFRDDKSLIVPIIYTEIQLQDISVKDIVTVTNVFKEIDSEKKLLFINELIDFLAPTYEGLRFKVLLENIAEFVTTCDNAYQYYLRDFSYNKLKLELDSKALEFTQKIQSVINDSQTKLVAIPTAFVLVFAAFDFKDLKSVKDIVAIVSLFIFAIIIQIFLENQASSLNFTKASILSYKETFSKNNLTKFEEKFALVDVELSKQRNRLWVVKLLLWLIPISLLLIWSVLIVISK